MTKAHWLRSEIEKFGREFHHNYFDWYDGEVAVTMSEMDDFTAVLLTTTKADWLRSEIEKLDGAKSEHEKLEKEHHEQFLADERRYKYDPSANNLEVMKLHEGSTSAYAGGLRWGKIETLTSIITRYTEELKVLEGK